MSQPNNLSVIIITLNEAERIERCLESVKDLASEIIVLDSGSTDGTLDIVRRYTNKIWQTDWPGYGKQKQRALSRARCNWVLSLDADEVLDETLREAVRAFLVQERGAVVACRLAWAVFFHGKRLHFGLGPRAPVRLAKREGAHFTDAEVHERLEPAPGKVVTLPGHLLHFTNKNYGHGSEKRARYTWLGSQAYFRKGRRCHNLLAVFLRAGWAFLWYYVFRGAFLDGAHGLLAATNHAQNNFDKYAGLWVLTREEKRGAKN